MDIEAAFELAKRSIITQTRKPLTDLQTLVLQGSIEGKTLSEITVSSRYNDSYVKKVASDLWKVLWVAFGEPVNKDNMRSVLEQHLRLEKLNSEPVVVQDQELVVPPSTPGLNSPELSNNYNKYQRGIRIPNLRCRQIWGRDEFSEELLSHLNDPQEVPILSLCGSAGYGKTEVAGKVARLAVQKNLFADVLWIKARDTEFVDGHISQPEQDEKLSWKQLQREIAHQLDGCTLDQVHHRLKEEKHLIVLDNAETAQLEDILPKLNELLNPSRVLLTSRFQTKMPYIRLINILPLEEQDSYHLLQYEAKYENIPALIQASPEQLRQVHKLSCGAPLALHFIVGQVLYDHSLEPVLSSLEQASGDVEKIYEFSLKTAWQKVSDPAKNILRYIGDSEAGVTWEELSGTSQVQESDWNMARRELKRWYLMEDEVDAQGKWRYNLHPWVRRSLRGGLIDKWQRPLEELRQILEKKYGIN